MTNQTKVLYSIIILLVFVFGLIIGLIWKDIPYISLNREVKVTEVATLLVTFSIGIFIPLLVKKWIDDNRSVKTYLVDEVKGIIVSIDSIKTKLKESFQSGLIEQKDKDEVNYIFHTIELQLYTFQEQFQVAFPNQSKKIVLELKEKYNSYKDFLTDGPMMVSTFTKVDDRFYRDHNQQHSHLEGYLKTFIQKIYKY